MSLAGDLFGMGLDLLRGVAGESTGTLTQDGTSYAFTLGRVVNDGRSPRRGRTDLKTRVLEIKASGVAVTPQVDSRITFTDETATWVVTEAEPIAPGGTTVAWRLTLVDVVDRED